MKMRRLIPVLVVLLCLAFVGCGEKEKCNAERELIAELKGNIAILKADKDRMDKMVDALNKEVAIFNLHIVQLEGTYQALHEAQEIPTFWNSFDWIASQVNIAFLGLLVLLILYRALHRRRNCQEE